MDLLAKSTILCAACNTIFEGNGEPFPGEGTEFFHHRSSDALREAVEGGCRLCMVLHTFLPEHFDRLVWSYQASPDDQPLPIWPWHSAPPCSTEAKSRPNPLFKGHQYLADRALHAGLSGRCHQDRSLRYFQLAERKRLNKLDESERKKDEIGFPEESRSALVYYRDRWASKIWFWFLGSTGRAGKGAWPIKFQLLEQNQFSPDLPTDVFDTSQDDYRCSSSSTSDHASRLLARHWLSSCRRDHMPSCFVRDSSFLPSRLLHISRDQVSDRYVVKLHCTSSKSPESVEYMTLSHCWGEPTKMFKVTHNNYDGFLKGVTLEDLPQHFREALEFAIFCNVQYLWIDALCIIQGNKDDWNLAASTMDAIYHNAVCNLSIATPSPPGATLFANRKPCMVMPLVVTARADVWPRITSASVKHFVCLTGELWNLCVDNAPVNQRGWVLQERILSPRKVIFAQHQLFWECRHKRACETLPGGLPASLTSQFDRWNTDSDLFARKLDETFKLRHTGQLLPSEDRDAKAKVLRQWDRFLLQYTECKLTYRDDRLWAINGICELVEKAIDDECLFGIWRKELPYQLVFWMGETHNSKDSASQLDSVRYNVRVPSWSWARYDAMLRQTPKWLRNHDQGTVFVSVDDFKYDKEVGSTINGHEVGFHAAYLRLKGHTFQCHIDPENCAPEWDTYRHFRLVTHIAGRNLKVVAHYDREIRINAFILPVYRNEGISTVWAILLTELYLPGSRIFERCGFVGTNSDLCSAFLEYVDTQPEPRELYLV